MNSIQKRVKLGFYLSVLGSIAIIATIAIWNFSYLSNLYSIQDRWNESVTFRLTKIASGEPIKQTRSDFEALQYLMNDTKKILAVSDEKFSGLKKSVETMQASPLNVRAITDSFNNFKTLEKEARNNAVGFLLMASFLIAAFNVLILTFLVFRPQRYLINFINTISEDIKGVNIGKETPPKYSRFIESSNLVDSFNNLAEKFSVYKRILTITERASTVDELTKGLYESLKPTVNFNGLCLVRIQGEKIKVETAISDSRIVSVRLPLYLDLSESISKDTLETKKPKIVNDLEEHLERNPDSKSAEIIIREGMRSMIVFPIFVEAPCIGFLVLFSKNAGNFTDEDVEKLEVLGGFLSLAYQKTSMAQDLILNSTIGFTNLVEEKDNETGKHVVRMSSYSKAIAGELAKKEFYSDKISQQCIQDIYEQAPLHDIGKVGIPDRILMKPGKLNEEEFEMMKKHTTIGYDILQRMDEKSELYGKKFFEKGAKIARHHHEKWDGTGYPDGLRGEEIPLCARIVAVADVFDALTSKRPYKEAIDYDRAFEMILESSGTHFDP